MREDTTKMSLNDIEVSSMANTLSAIFFFSIDKILLIHLKKPKISIPIRFSLSYRLYWLAVIRDY